MEHKYSLYSLPVFLCIIYLLSTIYYLLSLYLSLYLSIYHLSTLSIYSLAICLPPTGSVSLKNPDYHNGTIGSYPSWYLQY